MGEIGWADPRHEDEEAALFTRLRCLSEGLTTEGRASGRRLELDDFEMLADNLAVVRPAARLGEFRFEFYGSAFTDNSPGGDLTGMSFHDLMDAPYYRACLSGFWHVHRLGLAHVTRDHPVVGGRKKFFTRLLIPIFAGNRTALILCAARLHDEPTVSVPEIAQFESPFAESA